MRQLYVVILVIKHNLGLCFSYLRFMFLKAGREASRDSRRFADSGERSVSEISRVLICWNLENLNTDQVLVYLGFSSART